jgi:hypothetical protein
VIEPRNLYSGGHWITVSMNDGKADTVMRVKGSSSGHEKVSVQDTTGVEERGMSSKG